MFKNISKVFAELEGFFFLTVKGQERHDFI